jgi:hypothetical protein
MTPDLTHGQEAEHHLGWRSFVVDKTPHCMWGYDLTKQNRSYLTGMRPAFFNHISELHLPGLESADASTRQYSAHAIRINYSHALETFFALLCAAVQAPHCPLGWLLKYQSAELYSVVRKLMVGELVLSVHDGPLTWARLSAIVNEFNPPGDAALLGRIRQDFAHLWSRLAADFVDPMTLEEYNSIKHGFRGRPGGLSIKITPTDSDTPVVDSRSEFGTRFPTIEGLVPSGSAVGSAHRTRKQKNAINFCAREHFRNWSPRALAIRTELACLSMKNVIAFMTRRFGNDEGTVRFEWPENSEVIETAWNSGAAIIQSGTRMQHAVAYADIEPQTEESILKLYNRDQPPT